MEEPTEGGIYIKLLYMCILEAHGTTDMFTLQAGDTIKVTKQNENGMWEGELNGRKGHFPCKLVEVVDNTS